MNELTASAGLIAFDMDSTLISIECIDEIAALAGCKQAVSQVTEAAMRGDIDFQQSLRERVALLAGVEQTRLQQLFQPIPFNPGVQQCIATLQQAGWRCVLLSGGFTWFAERLQQALQLDAVVANQLEIEAGRLTGKVLGRIVDAQVKAQQLKMLAQRWQIPISRTVAVGDGANDRDMLLAAGTGVAYCAKPALNQIADIIYDQRDLSALATRLIDAQAKA
ncbi:phosphoserine phosphatase SerB [Idiomarina xiamenensis]|uniref:Phosphoserine phosphatase n=1 Tax=Idiomarina xiamenensis 10-D-4 TaxID=740709 RepID=K2JHM3_9GAMM|nr:phosphoserine phosphatase SerB [Idiomarina xiamenensis]EKE82871.1 phosphoserine phosphatase [Idiomarina xiamenensis 10-D-4]